MDILFLMKSIHTQLLLQAQAASSFEELQAACSQLFCLEDEFLIPEMEEVHGSAGENLLKQLLFKKSYLVGLFDQSSDFSACAEEVKAYLHWQQKQLIPAFRELIPTSVREDIGRAFQESLQPVS